MKRFKAKKRRNNRIIKIIIFIILIIVLIKFIKLPKFNNEKIVKYLIENNISIKYEKKKEVINEENNIEIAYKEDNKPLVYIFNTHNTEKYKSDFLNVYNIKSDVMLAGKILKEYLKDEGIEAIFENNSVQDKVNSLGLSYGGSYKISREFVELAYKNNPSLIYFIDLHRDSSSYEKTTFKIDNESYVKILFVIGLENKNYQDNLKLANDLSNLLKKENDNFVRGIMKKEGKNVNGIYNQDFSNNMMLIELGGQYNNIREVNNTLKIFAHVLSEYIKEKGYE